jgi:radical SAM superfamily enzyme YgiQ (UPF0313 family)
MDTDLKVRMSPSLALLTIANLTPQEHDVTIINENVDEIDFDFPADLVGITVTVDALPRAAEIAEKFKSKGKTVVAGGIHITACPKETETFFDSICVGKAEGVWVKMLEDFVSGHLEKVYRDPVNSPICSPLYDFKGKKKYIYTNVISTSRGCPFSCDFCYNSNCNMHYVNREIDDVIADIKTINRRHILFIDDNFIGNPVWTEKFLKRIIPMRLKWSAAITANVTDKMLDLMVESGCQSLFIGFESVNQDSLGAVHKIQNKRENFDILALRLQSRGIMINASIVFGLPNDTEKIFDETLEWCVKNRIETVTAHILTPYPGTKLYEKKLIEGKITDFDLSHYDTAHVVFKPDGMTSEALFDGYVNFYKELYSLKNIFRRLPLCKKQRVPFLLFNLLYRKFGRFTSAVSRILPLENMGKIAAKLSYKL